MAHSRLVLHPILLDKRSRFVFLILLTVAVLVGILAWIKLESALKQAGVSVIYGPPSSNLPLSIMLSSYFRAGLVLATAILAGAVTGQHIVGPVRRIQRWLEAYEQGQTGQPLKVRSSDKFYRLVELINRLCSPN
jgi:hypothetical protein